jgi:hypothetical protein
MPHYFATVTYPHDVLAEGQARRAPPVLLGHTNWWVEHTFNTNMRTMVVSPPLSRLVGTQRLPARMKSHKAPLPPLRSAYTAFARTQTNEPLPPTPVLPAYRSSLQGIERLAETQGDGLAEYPPGAKSATAQWNSTKGLRASGILGGAAGHRDGGGSDRGAAASRPTEAQVNNAMEMLRDKLMTRDIKASAAFRRYDRDHNGSLDRDEVILMLRENNLLDQFQRTPGLLEAVVRAIDVDGENNIEFRVVCACMAPCDPPPPHPLARRAPSDQDGWTGTSWFAEPLPSRCQNRCLDVVHVYIGPCPCPVLPPTPPSIPICTFDPDSSRPLVRPPPFLSLAVPPASPHPQFAAAMKRGQKVSDLKVKERKQVKIDDHQSAARDSGWRKTTNRSAAQAIAESQ